MIFFCLIFSIGIGAFVAWAIVKSYRAQMTNVVTPGQANEYVVKSSFRVHSEHDKFLYSNLQKIPRDTGNSRVGASGNVGARGGGGPRGGGPHGGGPRGGGGGPRGGGGRGGRR